MTGRVRAVARLAAVVIFTTVTFLSLLIRVPVALFSRAGGIRWRNFCFRTCSRALLSVMGARVECVGQPPQPPFFLVTNHLSYIDILVLSCVVDAQFVAKSEVARWPGIGWLTRLVGTIFVDRESSRDIPRVMAAIERTLESRQGVILFPEGTSTDGAAVAPFRSSLLEPAARASLAVSSASISYASEPGGEPAHLSICWWGDMEFAGHLWRLLAQPGFRARVRFGTGTVQDPDRKLLAARLWEEVNRLLEPVVRNHAPSSGHL